MLENIGQKIKEAREELRLSQKDLGMSLGLSDKAISAYEAARTVPPLETLVRIADELNKPIDYFIKSNIGEYKLETRLAAMEGTVNKLLVELQKIREQLANPTPTEPAPIQPTPATEEKKAVATPQPQTTNTTERLKELLTPEPTSTPE